jgi:radical SAM protein with 4Fe4S-binding SPASM domain
MLGLKKLYVSPPNIIFSLTSRCNKTCSFCHYITELNSQTHKEDELSFQNFKKLLDSQGAPSVGRICLYGGEPLLNKDIFQMLNEVRERKFFSTIVTNGLLIEKYMEELKKSGIDLMTVSYYPEDVDAIKESLIEISEYIPINLSFVVTQSNTSLIRDVLNYAKDISAVMVTIENLRENGTTIEKTINEDIEIMQLKKSLTKEFEDHYILRWSGFNSSLQKGQKISCIDFWDTIFVNAKGEVSPCCQYPLKSYSGDISRKDKSINSLEMIELRKKMTSNITPKECEGCHYLYSKDPLYKSN